MVEDRTLLVAYCGLYCGNCGSYKKGRCKSCREGGGFASCAIRRCCLERNFGTCAQCDDYMECRKLNNFIAKIFGLIFRSNRKQNLASIKNFGIEKWLEEISVSSKE